MPHPRERYISLIERLAAVREQASELRPVCNSLDFNFELKIGQIEYLVDSMSREVKVMAFDAAPAP